MSFEFLVLSQNDVELSASVQDYLEAAEEAFRAVGDLDTEASPKHHWEFSVGKSAAFASYIRSERVMAIKLGTIRPRNVSSYGLPPGISQILLHDAQSGRPLALLDGTLVTAMRTAAAAALGAKALARPDSRSVAVFGTGIVAEKSLTALEQLFSVEVARIVGSSPNRAEAFVAEKSELYAYPLAPCSAREAVTTADIIVTATTATAPIIGDEWVRPGTHISAIGSDWHGKQELDVRTLLRSVLVTDNYEQCLEIGEGNVPHSLGQLDLGNIDAELGQVIVGKATGRRTPEEISVFDSSGISVQDCTAAKRIYDRALQIGLGEKVTV